jgi:hypothetical protein
MARKYGEDIAWLTSRAKSVEALILVAYRYSMQHSLGARGTNFTSALCDPGDATLSFYSQRGSPGNDGSF